MGTRENNHRGRPRCRGIPAEPPAAADAFQRPLRVHFQARLSRSVRLLPQHGRRKKGNAEEQNRQVDVKRPGGREIEHAGQYEGVEIADVVAHEHHRWARAEMPGAVHAQPAAARANDEPRPAFHQSQT